MIYALWRLRDVALEKYGPLVFGGISVILSESVDRAATVFYEGGEF